MSDFNFDDLEFDFSDIQPADDYTPLPVGTYTFMVEHAELGVSPEKKTPQMVVSLVVVSPEEFEGRKVRHTFYFTQKSKPFLKRDLARFGVDMSGTVSLSELPFLLQDQVVIANTRLQLNNKDGKYYAHIGSFLTPDQTNNISQSEDRSMF